MAAVLAVAGSTACDSSHVSRPIDTDTAFKQPCGLLSRQTLQTFSGPSLETDKIAVVATKAATSASDSSCEFGQTHQTRGKLLTTRGIKSRAKFNEQANAGLAIKNAPGVYKAKSGAVFTGRKIGSNFYLVTLTSPKNLGVPSASTDVLVVALNEAVTKLGG
jgi:hypothetical protein